MARKKKGPKKVELIKQLIAEYKPETASDVSDMLKDMFSDTLEAMLLAELDSKGGTEVEKQEVGKNCKAVKPADPTRN